MNETMLKAFTILLVEDDPDDEHLIRRALSKFGSGAAVNVVRDGQEALDILLCPHAGLPSLVLLDIRLPKISGPDVLAALRQNRKTVDLPVIVLNSSYEPDDIRSSYEPFAHGSIRKPVDFVELKDLLASLGIWSPKVD